MAIHDYGEIDGQQFLEMRLIEGTACPKLLKRVGALSTATGGRHCGPDCVGVGCGPRRRGNPWRCQAGKHI